MTLYAVVFPRQQAQITAWCWGSCGHGIVGAVDLGPCAAVCCREEECPHLDKQMDMAMGAVGGEPVVLRKLLDVPEDEVERCPKETPADRDIRRAAEVEARYSAQLCGARKDVPF